MPPLRLDDASPIPLYHQLYRVLRDQVTARPVAAAGRFPSEQELVAQYGVSRITVRKALERLEADGVIVRRPGRGTFINPLHTQNGVLARDLSDPLSPETYWERYGVHLEVEVLGAERAPASGDVAGALGLAPDTPVLTLRRLVHAKGEPVWLESRFLPSDLSGALSPHDFSQYSIRVLLSRSGIEVTTLTVDVLAGAASNYEARRLGIAPGSPVLISEYTSFAHERAVQLGRAVYRSDRYKFSASIHSRDELQLPLVPQPMSKTD